jgi:hypothetical protein
MLRFGTPLRLLVYPRGTGGSERLLYGSLLTVYARIQST